jgi:aspartyl-tRNA(Asn)/glutamyl-tRNA(Gln) amidotransferase subunit B
VSDARLEEGSIRFDANVSIRPIGDEELGTKVEVKNMNSFRSLERAVDFEIERQVALVESGGSVTQETRHWDEEAGVTHSMRTKEGSSDYRYFTEPDLVPMAMSAEWVDRVRAGLPELPAQRRERYRSQGLDHETAGVLSGVDATLRSIYDDAVLSGAPARAAANWLTGEVVGWLRKRDAEATALPLGGAALAELISMVDGGMVSSSAAKEVLDGVLSGEGNPEVVARARDLLQMSDTSELGKIVSDVLAANPQAMAEYRAGEDKVVGYLVGQVMKATQGKADPRAVNQILRDQMAG